RWVEAAANDYSLVHPATIDADYNKSTAVFTPKVAGRFSIAPYTTTMSEIGGKPQTETTAAYERPVIIEVGGVGGKPPESGQPVQNQPVQTQVGQPMNAMANAGANTQSQTLHNFANMGDVYNFVRASSVSGPDKYAALKEINSLKDMAQAEKAALLSQFNTLPVEDLVLHLKSHNYK
ncbi:MAG TPA: hypothetical protein PLO51_03010, partial [Candidatus Micrarchaeota archaeon]|nr:hypothetical protein [Candidatus Micrarchaeota archaeon]